MVMVLLGQDGISGCICFEFPFIRSHGFACICGHELYFISYHITPTTKCYHDMYTTVTLIGMG